MLKYSEISHLVADNTPAEIAAILQADRRTVADVDLGDLLYMMNFRGMLVRRIRPTDAGEKWEGTIPAMIAVANATAPPELAMAVNQWFSHITNDRNTSFQTTSVDFANLFGAIAATFADGEGMPTTSDFDAVLTLGGGLRYANVTKEDVEACIAEEAARIVREEISAVWMAKQAVVNEGIFNGSITTLEQIVAAIGGE